MKKLIFSIAALAAIVVMGSCSQDSDLTNKTASSKAKQDSVTIGLSINTGITVSESNSSMAKSTANVPITRAAATRADATGSTTSSSSANTNNPGSNFVPTYPSSYTVYFVADQAQGDYKDQEIVYTMNITATNSNLTTATTSGSATATEVYSATGIKIPALNYKVYVTNYSTSQKAGGEFKAETLPTSSTTLYLNNGVGTTADLTSKSTNRTVTVALTNNYAAVAVAANDFVSAVAYKGTSNDVTGVETSYANNSTISSTNTNVTWKVGGWFYLYINTTTTTSPTTNSKFTIENINGITKSTEETLDKAITAGNIYQYIINDNYTGGTLNNTGGTTGGSGDGLTISVTPFTNNGTSDLSVY
jgi:hypothetical protein